MKTYGWRYNQRGMGGVDGGLLVPAGSTVLYSVTFDDVAFGVNWGFNWLGSGTCREAVNNAIRTTGAFNSVSIVPGNFTDNNCVQAQAQLVTAFDWNVGDMRWVLDDLLNKAGFSVNSSNLTVTARPQSNEPKIATPGTGSTSPLNYYQSLDTTPKGIFDDFAGSLGLSTSTLILGAVVVTLALVARK